LRLNLDNMKIVNERYGSAAGDVVIQTQAKNFLRECHLNFKHTLMFHLFMDEFAIIIPTKKEETLFEALNSIRAKICTMPIEIPHKKRKRKRVKLSVSGGLFCSSRGMKFNQWMKTCEAAMKKAKSGGKNRIEHTLSDVASNIWSVDFYSTLESFISKPGYCVTAAERHFKNGASLNFQHPSDQMTAVMLALKKTKDPSLLSLLLEKDFNCNLQDKLGKTCLIHAIENQQSEAIIQNLLQRPVDFSVCDKFGSSALSTALRLGRKTIAASILKLQGGKISKEQAQKFPELMSVPGTESGI